LKKKKELENSRNKLKLVLPYNTLFESSFVQENKKKKLSKFISQKSQAQLG